MSTFELVTKNLKMLSRKRTEFIQFYYVDTGGKSVQDLFIDARRRGDLTVPFHFLVHTEGLVEEGRKIHEIGDTDLNPEGDAIIVFIDEDSQVFGVPYYASDEIVESLTNLIETLEGTYGTLAMEQGDITKWEKLIQK